MNDQLNQFQSYQDSLIKQNIQTQAETSAFNSKDFNAQSTKNIPRHLEFLSELKHQRFINQNEKRQQDVKT